ncbi:MAG TPA: zf-HC2 domain-containing protein [Actinomycetota bacterium]|nr:zf-HC2 domain-containing protein [Actinomycetota bacterium]
MECREAAEHIPAYVDQPGGPAARALDAHLRACEPCSRELRAYREMQGALSALATQIIEPPAWLLPSTIDAVRARTTLRRIPAAAGRVRKRLADPKVAVAGGAAILLAGLATGAVLIRGRRRRRRLVTGLRQAALA